MTGPGQSKDRPQVVPYADDMRQQVFELYADVFGAAAAEVFKRRFDWSQERNLFPARTGRWAIIKDDRVEGFLGTAPLEYNIAGKRIIAHTPCDFMVRPGARFHGIKLMQQFFKECENCITCDDIEATIAITRWLGAQDAGRMVRYARVLNTLSMRKDRLATVPSFAFKVANMGLRLYERAWLSGRGRGVHVEEVDDFDQRFEDFYNTWSESVPVSVVRDLKFLKWRYGPESLHRDRRIAVVGDGKSGIAGYVVYYVSQAGASRRLDQPAVRNQGFILDLQGAGEGRDRVVAALLEHAVASMRREGAWTAHLHQVPSLHAIKDTELKAHGFYPRSSHRMLIKLDNHEAHTIASVIANWNYSYGDSEASHSIV